MGNWHLDAYRWERIGKRKELELVAHYSRISSVAVLFLIVWAHARLRLCTFRKALQGYDYNSVVVVVVIVVVVKGKGLAWY